MKNILHVIVSPLGENSFSIRLGSELIEQLKQKYPDANVVDYDLTQKNFGHIDGESLMAFGAEDETQLNAKQKEILAISNEAIDAIKNADIIVVGAPLYNMGIHSLQKAWIDHICRAGVTFRYTEDGAEGLIKGKQAFIAMSSGGIYSEGALQDSDFVSPYLEKILNFIGIEDVTTYRVEGVAIPGIKEEALEKAVESVEL